MTKNYNFYSLQMKTKTSHSNNNSNGSFIFLFLLPFSRFFYLYFVYLTVKKKYKTFRPMNQNKTLPEIQGRDARWGVQKKKICIISK